MCEINMPKQLTQLQKKYGVLNGFKVRTMHHLTSRQLQSLHPHFAEADWVEFLEIVQFSRKTQRKVTFGFVEILG